MPAPSILENPHSHPPLSPVPKNAVPAASLPAKHSALKDSTPLTIYPITDSTKLHPTLLSFLCQEFNDELERGDTYPLEEPMTVEAFTKYWFGSLGVVAVMGERVKRAEDLAVEREEGEWGSIVAGTFYIKSNYPGRSSHVCNAGFLTTTTARGRGIGRALGEAYLFFAPKLGYRYSVFNLVYANNAASLRIWDGLGFNRIGLVKGAGRLRSAGEGNYVDAIIYGKDLVELREKEEQKP